MSAKEEIRRKVRSVREGWLTVFSRPVVVKWAEYLIRAILCFVLAGAEIFENYAPFALAMTAASGAGAGGVFALLGGCLGYLAFRGFVDALAYVAACILTFAVGFAFSDVTLCRQGWFMPLISALLGGVTGFVHRSEALGQATQVMFFAAELVLVVVSAYFYRLALSPWENQQEETLSPRQITGILLLGCTLLISLAEIQLWDVVSLGCTAGALISMIAAWKLGAGGGAATGVVVGLAMDLSLGQAGHYAVSYALAGVLSGAARKRGKLLAVLFYVLANGAVFFWRSSFDTDLSVLYEVFIAAVVFMVLPESLLGRIEIGLKQERERAWEEDEWARESAKEKLEYTANAFRELYDGLRTSFRRVAPNDADLSSVFHRAANKVCVRCALRDCCWQREYATTMNALNDALPAMMKRGRGEAEDFPSHFRTRCLNFQALIANANEELTALRYRRQFQSRAREGREAVCRQYGLFAGVLDEVVRKMEEKQVFDLRKEKQVGRYLATIGVVAQTRVWYDGSGRLVLEIAGAELDVLKQDEEREKLSHLLQVPLDDGEEQDRSDIARIRWRQAEPLMAVAGVSAQKKEGQTVSGDAGAWFKTEDGGVYVLLCDGMGSGREAHRESTLAIRLLEKFLRTGMEPEEALNTLNSALALRGDEEGGFTTVDLLRLDLFTGEAGFYKLGAAPTYIRRKGAVSRVTGATLPAGLNAGGAGPDVSKMRLEVGDSVVMVSDGVVSPEQDGWLKQMLAVYDGADPKSLAADLIRIGTEHEGDADDRTAVVLTIKAR